MSFAEGLLLAYLKVGVLAAAIMAGVWLIARAAVKLHRWEQDTTARAASDEAAGDGGADETGRPPGPAA